MQSLVTVYGVGVKNNRHIEKEVHCTALFLWCCSLTGTHDFLACTSTCTCIYPWPLYGRMVPSMQTCSQVCINCHLCICHLFTCICHFSQSLRKRFLAYSFLWEQDVLETFDGFLRGVTRPHPQHFTRPEMMNRARSASCSARSRRWATYFAKYVKSSVQFCMSW